MKFHVWCLTWEDDESHGSDVETAKIGEYESTRARIVSWSIKSASDAVEVYAEFCHNHRDGWEATWPLKFRVRSEDGSVQDFEVEREMVPSFTARKPKP